MPYHQAENVVLGFATNLAPERLEVFAKTLRQVYSPQECDLVICTNIVDDQLLQLSEKYSVRFFYTPNNYSGRVSKLAKLFNRLIIYPTKWLAELTQNTASLKVVFNDLYPQLLKLWHHPHFVRWFTYKDFLKTNRHYRKIFISDVKDVAFQTDFFSHLDSSDLNFFKQDVQYGGDDVWDTAWYRDSYGSAELNKVVGKPAFCIGTIAGNLKGVEAFIDVLCAEILKTPFIGVEQSVFNHLFYTNAFQNIHFEIQENAAGVVLTLNGRSWHRFSVRSNGLFTENGELIPVVHMYDRHQEALNYFSDLVGYELKEEGLVSYHAEVGNSASN